jgi:type IX secretion system PorP/SprF family membrane protein
MKKFKHILVIAGLIFQTSVLSAQQDPMYTHYMYNTLIVNPAYAGSRDALSVTGLGRFQWVGLNGAPMSQTIQVHSPIFAGLCGGISMKNDRIGPVNNTNLNIDLAYQFRFAQHSRLSIGMRYSVDFFNNFLNNLNPETPNDPVFANNYNITLGNVGAGIYYQHTKFYLGFSIPNIIEHDLNNTSGLATERRHYFAIAGAYFKVSRTVDLKPTGLVKIVAQAPVQLDLTLEAIFQKKVSVGVHGRLFDGAGILLGYNIMPNFRIGYAFDWSFTQMMNAGQYGSHEVMLRYDLSWGRFAKVNNPRYF